MNCRQLGEQSGCAGGKDACTDVICSCVMNTSTKLQYITINSGWCDGFIALKCAWQSRYLHQRFWWRVCTVHLSTSGVLRLLREQTRLEQANFQCTSRFAVWQEIVTASTGIRRHLPLLRHHTHLSAAGLANCHFGCAQQCVRRNYHGRGVPGSTHVAAPGN